MKKNGWVPFYFYSVFLGIRCLVRNPLKFSKEALKRILIPMDIFRYFEIPATFRELKPGKGEKILDLSSPKLLSYFIAEKTGAEVVASDIWKEELASWKELKKILKSSLLNRKLTFKIVDGKDLPYKKNYFDKIFSVSVIEHIEKDGDSITMRELARVLKPGGRLVLTLPLVRHYFEKWVDRDVYSNKFENKTLFSYRKYDRRALRKRIVVPSGLILEKEVVCEEKFIWFYHLYAALSPMLSVFGLAFPVWAVLSLKEGSRRGKSSCILLVLKKD